MGTYRTELPVRSFFGKSSPDFLLYGQVAAGFWIVTSYNSASEKEIHKKNIENLSDMRYNYLVNLFIQSGPGTTPAGEMR